MTCAWSATWCNTVFYTAHLERSGHASETVEGIRALAIDKDYKPVWNPARLSDVTAAMVEPFFVNPGARRHIRCATFID